MKYFKNKKDKIFAFEQDGSQDHKIKKNMQPITEDDAGKIAEEKQKKAMSKIPYNLLRQGEYNNGDYIDAIMGEMNYRRSQGEKMTQPMDDALGHWLGVKRKFPKPEQKKNKKANKK